MRSLGLAASVIALLVAGCGGGNGSGNDTDPCPEGTVSAEATVSYAKDIFPLLTTKGCMTSGCHGGLLLASAYDLQNYVTTFGPALEAQDLGVCNVVPGNPDASYVLEKLRPNPRSGEQMPLNRPPLSAEELQLIATWIQEGAGNN